MQYLLQRAFLGLCAQVRNCVLIQLPVHPLCTPAAALLSVVLCTLPLAYTPALEFVFLI